MRLVVFAMPPVISVDAFHNAHQREPRLKTAARLGESCSKLSAVRDKQVHQRVTDLSESTRARICR